MQGGFLAGDRRRALAAPRAPKFLPLLCYEIIFPHDVVPPGERAGWFLNLTNDGWFGISTGPHQHFQQARVRAIEEGLPLVRAANTGISGIVDPYGHVIERSAIFQPAVTVGEARFLRTSTFYARHGDIVAYASVLATAALLVVACRVK